jgi:hypothetical protein
MKKGRWVAVVPVLAGLFLTGVPQGVLAAGCKSYYPVSYSYYTPYVQKEYVVQQVIKEIPIYVAKFVPVVSVGYAPAPVAAPAMSAAMPSQAINPCAELQGRVAQLEALIRGQAPPQYGPQQGPVPNGNGYRQGTPQQGVPYPPKAPNGGHYNTTPQPQQAPQAEPVPPPQTPPEGQVSGPQAAVIPSHHGVFVKRCAECHTQGANKGGFPLLAQGGAPLQLTGEQKAKVIQYVKGAAGKVPKCPKDSPLTDEEFGQVLSVVD